MPDLPPELWIVTLDRLRFQQSTDIFPDPLDIPTLKILTLTSRSFQSLAEPLIYERVWLHGFDLSVVRKVDRLLSRPEMLPWIKYLTISSCSDDTYHRILSICPKLHALKGISLNPARIEVQTMSAILRLPSLERWASSNIRFEGGTRALNISTEHSRLTHVRLSLSLACKADNEIIARLVLGPSLRSLSLWHGLATSIAFYGINPVKYCSLLQLQSFEGDIPCNIDDLYDFLRRCPSITSISLWDPPEIPQPDPLPQLPPPDLLPSLREFRGSSRSAQHFVPGRPVDKISITYSHDHDHEEDKAFFASLGKSSVPVKAFCMTLAAPTFRPAFAPVAAAFPSLESLRIEAPRSIDQFLEPALFEDLAPLSSLRTIQYMGTLNFTGHIFSDGGDMDVQAEVVGRLKEQHPAIERVEFSGGVKWAQDAITGEWTQRR